MKKFIFSAIAMIAFVGSSMASNDINLIEDDLASNEKNCTEYALNNALAESAASPQQLTLTQLIAAVAAYYSFCEESEGILLEAVQIKRVK